MDKQWSFLRKPTRFVVISLTLSFSFVFLSFFCFWVIHSHRVIHQKSYFLLSTPSLSLSLSPLKFESLSGSLADSYGNGVNFTNLNNTHLGKPGNLKGIVDLVANFSVDNAKGLNLIDAHLREPRNTSGFELQRKVSAVNISEEVDEVGSNEGKYDNNRGSYGSKMQESEPKNVSIGKVVEVFEEKKVKDCDISKGKWVFDENYPLYTNLSCPFIDEGFNCKGNGRIDNDYMKWKWQPQECNIPRFNATNMLELIRGKRVVFAGDSINRNQWESLLCLLMGAVKDPRKVYETRGRPITKEKGIYSIRFVDYQCTVEFYVTHFLVHESKARIGRKRKGTLRIDSIDKGSSKWRGADILIFNTGNWWSHFKTKAGINYYQEGKQVYPRLDPQTAYRKALATWATWVDRYINPHKTHVFFRSTAPAHFRGGQWNSGGHCREARKPLNEMYIEDPAKDLIAEEVIKTMKTPVTFLNVTGLSSYRIDGHPSKYGRNPAKGISSVEDCSHWCLPGVPDTWNELIYYQLLLKQEKSVISS